MSDPYSLLRFIHIVSAAILFGTGIGIAFFMWMAHRSRDVAAIAATARHVVIADLIFTAVAVIVQPVTGWLLIREAGYDPHAPWLIATYVLYGITGLCWLPVVGLQVRIRNTAITASQRGAALPERYFRDMQIWFWLGWPAFISVLAIYLLMVLRASL